MIGVPEPAKAGRAYTLAVMAMRWLNFVTVLVGFGAYRDGTLAEFVTHMPNYFLAMLVLGGAATAPNIAERIGWKGTAPAAQMQAQQQERQNITHTPPP